MKILKSFRDPVQECSEGPMAHVSDKVKVNMLLLWCGPDGEDIYEGFNLDEQHEYDLELVWFYLITIANPYATFELQGGNSGL